MILKCLAVGYLKANCYIVGDEETNEVMVIDPGAEVEKIYNIIHDNEYTVKYILLTHGHADHISAVKSLKEKTNAKVVIHKDDSDALLDSKLNLSMYMGFHSIQAPADIKLVHNEELTVGKYRFKIMHTPGHTPGGICILTDHILFTGDTLFHESIGRTDLPGGDYQTLLSSIKEYLMNLDDGIVVYPGHGEKTTIGHERLYNSFLK